jgi:phosphoribosylformylglycinamidine synthase I
VARVGVIVFPGSNCDHDAYHALKHVMNAEVKFLWHKETDVSGLDMIIVPGGFSYGDYLRSGAIARFSPIMQELIGYAQKGGPVMGICNGFQILLEAGLIPGAMRHNEQLKFICKDVHIRVESTQSIYTSSLQKDQLLTIPVSHGEGNYYIDNDGLKELQDSDQVLFRYVNAHGETTPEANINGSVDHIAGITNKQKNVLGMMPHPERAMERLLGKEDGKHIFESVLQALEIA